MTRRVEIYLKTGSRPGEPGYESTITALGLADRASPSRPIPYRNLSDVSEPLLVYPDLDENTAYVFCRNLIGISGLYVLNLDHGTSSTKRKEN